MPDEILTRTVNILAPVAGTVVVTINLTKLCNGIAEVAFTNSHGKTDSELHLRAQGECSKETLAARNALLRLKNVPRKGLQDWKVCQEEDLQFKGVLLPTR